MTSPLEVHNVFGVVPGQAVYSNTHTVVRGGTTNPKNQNANPVPKVALGKEAPFFSLPGSSLRFRARLIPHRV
jgi:hypothetical protein